MSSSDRVSASVGAGRKGGKEPDLKRRRLLDAGGPIEDDETARQKMRDAQVHKIGVARAVDEYDGFDPYNVWDVKSHDPYDEYADVDTSITPMGYFAWKGDLLMMRWLYVNGADTLSVYVVAYFPMRLAAINGNLDVCEWLFEHGAAGDIKRRSGYGFTPLSTLFDESDKRDVCRWLILRGALCKDGDTGDLDIDLMKSSLSQFDGSAEERSELLKWAREHHLSRSSFDVFLMGTLSKPQYSAAKLRESLMSRIRSEKVVDRLLRNTPPDQYHLLWNDWNLFPRRVCPLAVFCGKSGILELIGDYVGIMRGREARIVRQLTELLPDVIIELAAEPSGTRNMLGSDTHASDDSE